MGGRSTWLSLDIRRRSEYSAGFSAVYRIYNGIGGDDFVVDEPMPDEFSVGAADVISGAPAGSIQASPDKSSALSPLSSRFSEASGGWISSLGACRRNLVLAITNFQLEMLT